jgi:hypothetical protein
MVQQLYHFIADKNNLLLWLAGISIPLADSLQ